MRSFTDPIRIGPHPGAPQETGRAARQRRARQRRPRGAHFPRRWFTQLVGETGVSTAEAEAGTWLALETMRGFRIRLPQPQRVSDSVLRSIGAPALVLPGDADRVLDSRRAEARARRLLPDARTEVVPGTGHRIPVALFNSRVPGFLHAVEETDGA